MSPVLIAGALFRQMKLTSHSGSGPSNCSPLRESEKRLLNEVPMRGTPMPRPTR